MAQEYFDGFTVDKIDVQPVVREDRSGLTSPIIAGTVAGAVNDMVIDGKDHFPIVTPDQARSSMNRAMSLKTAPDWFSGTIDDLQHCLYANIKEAHPELDLKVSIPVAVALSDGQTPAEETKVKDPMDDQSKNPVPQAKRPSISKSAMMQSLLKTKGEKVLAADLQKSLKQSLERIQDAIALAERMGATGLSAEEFGMLYSYLQEEILYSLLNEGVKASSEHREQLIASLKRSKNGQ